MLAVRQSFCRLCLGGIILTMFPAMSSDAKAGRASITVTNNHPFAVSVPLSIPLVDDVGAAPLLVPVDGAPIAGQVDVGERGAEISFSLNLPPSQTVKLTVEPTPNTPPLSRSADIDLVIPDLLVFEGPSSMYSRLNDVVDQAEPLNLDWFLVSTGPVRHVFRAETAWRGYHLSGYLYAYASGPVDIDLCVEQQGESKPGTYLTIVKRLSKAPQERVWTRYKGVSTIVPVGWQPLYRQNRMESWSRDSQWVLVGGADGGGRAMLFDFTLSFTFLNPGTKRYEIANDFMVNERVVNTSDAVYVFSDLTGTNALSYIGQSFITPPKGWSRHLRWRYLPEAQGETEVDQEFLVYAGYQRQANSDGEYGLTFGVGAVQFGSSHYPHAFLAEDFLYWRTNGPANLYTYLGDRWDRFKYEIDRDFKIMNALGLEWLGMAPMFERIYRYSSPDGVYLQPPLENLPAIVRKRVDQIQQPGRWSLEFLDYVAELAVKYGLQFVLDARISPTDAAYLVDRYRDVVGYYEVENEVLLLSGVPVDRIAYWQALYRAIREANPEVKVFWNGGPSHQAAFEQLAALDIGFDAVGVHEYVDRRESPDYVRDTALAHGAYAAQQDKEALLGEFNWRYLARESEEAQAEHFYAIADALLSQRSTDIFMQYKFADTYSIQPEQQKGIRHYELLRLDRTLKPQGKAYLELIRKYGDPNAPISMLHIVIPEVTISPDAWSTVQVSLTNESPMHMTIPLAWELPPEVELVGQLPSPFELGPGQSASLKAQVRLREGSRPGFYHLFLQTQVQGRLFYGWGTASYTAQPVLDLETPAFIGVTYAQGLESLQTFDFTQPGTVVLGDTTDEIEWSYALHNTLRSATGSAYNRAAPGDLGDQLRGNLLVVGACSGLARRLVPGGNETGQTMVHIGPNPFNPEKRVVVFLGPEVGKAVADFIFRYWQGAKDAVTFDQRMAPPVLDAAVVPMG